jgi:hypothetical protein
MVQGPASWVFLNSALGKNRPHGILKLAPRQLVFGTNVLIFKILCNFKYDQNFFLQFSAKKMAFFSKTNVMINFFQNLALF